MIINLMIHGKEVIAALRAEGEGKTQGDLFRNIKPGGNFFGVTYAELLKLGSGEHTIPNLPKK